jgi:hypothetical protein
MEALAKIPACALYSLARCVSKGHLLTGATVSKSHFDCSVVGSVLGYI